jgi:parallel beta-helix repeat protein
MHRFSMSGRKMRSVVREDTMKQPGALFPIAFGLGAVALSPGAVAREPTVITACQTISQPGRYVLANSILTASGGPCLTITASGVTIDLDGFFVGAFGNAITVPLGGPPVQGTTIKNGSASSRNGAAVVLGDGSKVTGLHVSSGHIGTGIRANGIVRGNVVTDVFGPGIAASGTVTDNYVNGVLPYPGSPGSGVGISARGTVRGNTATNNEVGIEVSAGSEVIDNTAADNTKIGIQAECPSNLIDNTAVNNGMNLVLIGQGCNSKHNVVGAGPPPSH